MLQDLLGTDRQVCLRPHWQRQQGEPWIEISLLAQFLQAQPDHLVNKRLQLLGQLGWTKLETPVRHHHHHGQMQHLGVELEKASGLSKQTVLEPRLAVHLHLEKHRRLFWCALVSRARPKRTIKTMVCGF